MPQPPFEHVPAEAEPADVAEQALDVAPEDPDADGSRPAGAPAGLPPEADEGDAVEQSLEVPQDEEDVPR